MKKQFILLVMTVVLAMNTGCRKKQPIPPAEPETPANAEVAKDAQKTSEEIQKAKLGDKAGSLDGLTYLKGKPVTFEAGKVYVVEFWATWCGPCKTSIPHLTEIQKKYQDKNVTVLGISNEKDTEKVKTFVDNQADKMDYTVAMDSERKISPGYMTAYSRRGIPSAFIVDGKGNVVWVGHPMSDLDDVLGQIVAGEFDAEAYAKAKAEREEKQRKLDQLCGDYMKGLKNGNPTETFNTMNEQLLAEGDAQILNELSWTILTEAKEGQQDIETALKFAEKAVELTKAENAAILDTYALALFENGRIDEAVKNQTKALDILKGQGSEIPEDMKLRLEQFKKKLAESIV